MQGFLKLVGKKSAKRYVVLDLVDQELAVYDKKGARRKRVLCVPLRHVRSLARAKRSFAVYYSVYGEQGFPESLIFSGRDSELWLEALKSAVASLRDSEAPHSSISSLALSPRSPAKAQEREIVVQLPQMGAASLSPRGGVDMQQHYAAQQQAWMQQQMWLQQQQALASQLFAVPPHIPVVQKAAAEQQRAPAVPGGVPDAPQEIVSEED